MEDKFKLSPFSFLCWKEDDESLMASTLENDNYISLISVDGIPVEDIVGYAQKHYPKWEDCIALVFPKCVAALASINETPCFADGGAAKVEYSDSVTWEVHEGDFPASRAAYDKSVKIENERNAHGEAVKEAKKNAKAGDADDDDDFESVDDEEEEDEEDTELAHEHNTVAMMTSQMEAAIFMAGHLGLSVEDIASVIQSQLSIPLPHTVEDCVNSATSAAVLEFLQH